MTVTSCSKEEFKAITQMSTTDYRNYFIDENSRVCIELKKAGYRPRQKILTPRQIKICLIEYCGLDQHYKFEQFFVSLNEYRKTQKHEKI